MTTFYPHDEDVEGSTPQARLDLLLEAAERYKAVVLDVNSASDVGLNAEGLKRRVTPKDIKVAFNWQEIAKVMREIREMPEAPDTSKQLKSTLLTKLASVYEVLRAAKMPKLEAVRMALMNEANQLKGSG